MQVAQALTYLHKNNVIHRDLKSMNILLSQTYKEKSQPLFKVTDFGISKIISNTTIKSTMTIGVGTVMWMAPEMLNPKNKVYDSKVDVYSFAIVMWELFSRKLPYSGIDNPLEIIEYVRFEGGRPDCNLIDKNTPKSAIELMKKCWDPSPNNRPTIIEVVDLLKAMI